MKHHPLILLLLLVTIVFSACADPHIGKQVSYRWDNVCRCKSFPSTCHLALEHFDFNFDVEQRNEKAYFLSGEALNTKNVGASRIYGGTFTFLLVNKGIITETFTFVPKGTLGQSISFKKSFTPQEEFDGILVSYSITVK